jgi:hypothetical protein
MRKTFIIAAAMLFLVSSAFAGVSTVSLSKSEVQADRITVPVTLKNDRMMTGMELPLKYSEGVTLEEVSFEGTRAENFDLKVARIIDEENTVVIALIPMVYGDKTDLDAGSGVIANLIFRVDDPTVEEIELTPTKIDYPNHSALFVYTEFDGDKPKMMVEEPQFESITVDLLTSGSNVPMSFGLHQNYPNPFNPSTIIQYDLPAPSKVRLEIFNVLGQQVKTLVDDYKEAGYQSVTWNGDDDNGGSVATGIYFYKISADNKVETKKMMLLK